MANTDYTIPDTGYATFDALTMKQLVKDRLTESGFYTDHNFEGSNLSSLIDVLAYSYHVQMFYLNQTSSESLFTDAQLYENINRIVSLLGYNPRGYQTCRLGYNLKGLKTLPKGAYVIPRYSYVTASGVQYCTPYEIYISKHATGEEIIKNIQDRYVLYQGIPQEYPLIAANGDAFEKHSILAGADISIDHDTIHVYVKDVNTLEWSEWTGVEALYTQSSNSLSFETRLNEKKNYELKFGNNITGKQLNIGDTIAIYYLKSDGTRGKVGPSTISKTASLFTTARFIEIFSDIKNKDTNYIDANDLQKLEFSNDEFSTNFFEGETVEDIKQNAPHIFSSQNRAVTKNDYESYIKHNYGHTIKSVKVVDNEQYLSGHVKYITDILDATTTSDVTALYNQLQFADSTNFNNVYIYAVPQQETISSYIYRYNYLSLSQKNTILNSLKDRKALTTESIINDPVYMALSFGVSLPGETLSTDISDKTELIVYKNPDSAISEEGILSKIYEILKKYFEGAMLGQTIDLNGLASSILNITGVDNFVTRRKDTTSIKVNGLNFIMWNPIYRDKDITLVNSNITLPYYKYPYIHDILSMTDKIVVEVSPSS